MNTPPSSIGIVGGGWRATAFFTIASALPEHFDIVGALVRSESSAAALRTSRNISATTSLAEFIGNGPYGYVIVCVPGVLAPDFVVEFAHRDIPVLVETPPAVDLAAALDLYRRLGNDCPVQVAEQYRLQPHHAARVAVARSGILGTVTSAYASVAHDYHGMSLLRALLEVGSDEVTVSADSFSDVVVSTLSRTGWASESTEKLSNRITARLQFPERGLLAVYEFGSEQYFSPIRSRHVSAFGRRGEITDDTVRYMRGPGEPITLALVRHQTGIDGDLEGSFLRRITAGERTFYENPVAPARLSDDEIALASVLLHMNEFANGGVGFYGLADASQDNYLSFLITEALTTGNPVQSAPQPWSSRVGPPSR